MKVLTSSLSVLALFTILFFTACEKEENQSPDVDLAGTTWVSNENGRTAVVAFSEETWTRTIADENRFYQGTYEYTPPKIIFSQLDDNGDVELLSEGEVIDENTLTIETDTYTRQ